MTCRCNENPCPLQGHCNVKNIIYEASLNSNTPQNPPEKFTYIGMSCRKLIERYKIHKRSSKNENINSTTLSNKLWELKNEQKTPSVNFKIKKLAKSYELGFRFGTVKMQILQICFAAAKRCHSRVSNCHVDVNLTENNKTIDVDILFVTG